jgi:hypothetical protein
VQIIIADRDKINILPEIDRFAKKRENKNADGGKNETVNVTKVKTCSYLAPSINFLDSI